MRLKCFITLECSGIFSTGNDVFFVASTLSQTFRDANENCKIHGGSILSISTQQERKYFLSGLKHAYFNGKHPTQL